ncbi:MAG: hypothetical protein WD844_02485 [Thermoleophilaceae bacterium]
MTWARRAALASSGLLAASILLLPWYGLGAYEPNGWDASFWLRAAVVLAALNLVSVRADGRAAGSAPLAALALALVAARVVLPPDFGFDFDGLDVPVERRVGAWVGLAAAAAAVAAGLVGRAPRQAPSRAGGW